MRKSRLVLLLLFPLGCLAQLGQDTTQKIEKIFSVYTPDNPGCMLSISRDGQTIFSKAWGLADLERNTPLTTTSVTEAGSVSKQFTAAAILLLQQQGKLSVSDDIRKYIPEIPEYGSPILIRHLIHHSSGLRDWGAIAEISGWPRGSKNYTNGDALDIIIHQKALNFAPNTKYSYSNSNYNLLAVIVQRVSGMSLAEFTHKYIFGPAGMTHTQWRDDHNRIVPNRAIAYNQQHDVWQIDMPNEDAYGNGGLLTTTEDLLKWNSFYSTGRLGGNTFLKDQLRTEPLNDDKPNQYAAGLFIGKQWGYDHISHDGVTAGYRARLESYPQLHLDIAWLSNNPKINGAVLIDQVTALFIPEARPGFQDTNLPGDQIFIPLKHPLSTYTGSYYSEEAQAGIEIKEKDGRLWMVRPGGRIAAFVVIGDETALGPTELFSGDHNVYIKFIRENGTITGFTISVPRASNVVFVKKNATPQK